MKKFPLFLLFLFLNLHSQQIIHKEEFKKCRKEFSKKICLSDNDKDSILFYLDKCPKENGPLENSGCPFPDTDVDGIIDKDDACPREKGEIYNNGCPWPDTDGDGILDKDDACPTLPGVAEENGCPKRGDCKEYFEKENRELIAFKEKNLNEKQKFISLRKIIFNNVSKVFLASKNIYVSIYVDTFVNDNYTVQCSSRSTLYHDKKLFLDQLFWSEDTFKYIAKNYNKNIFPTIGMHASKIINKNLIREFNKYGYYSFMLDFPEVEAGDKTGLYYPKNKQKPKFDGPTTRLVVNFSQYETGNKVVAEFYEDRYQYFHTYQYIANQWKLIKTEKNRY
ncbi:MAG: hypothetical protein DI622_05780 [Chryseobacterium sp.]|nr:hypothetical protein [Chryseobacterium sp.]PZU22574.1 MAG: hypothetical protein DI622_05780 [Chryseobacterium sp.]